MKFNNWLQKGCVIVLFLSAILFIIFSSLKDLGSEEYISMEAENAEYVSAPLYIEQDKDASGGKFVVSRGVHKNRSGIAKYKILAKKEGKYYFWGKCYWKDACSNLFVIEHNKIRHWYGNNPVFGKWHWVKGPAMDFKQGINEFLLFNSDEDSMIDEMLLTMDPEYVPFDKSREVYFLDFEDSLVNKLEIKNKGSWHIVNHIINDSISSVYVSILPKENKEIALLNKTSCKDDFIFQVIAKPVELQSKLLIILDYINDHDYRFISIDHTTARYCHFNSANEDLIFEKEGKFLNNDFNSVALAKTNGFLKLKIDGKAVFDFSINTKMTGKIGIGASDGNVFVDNIAYYFPASFVQEDSFHDNIDLVFHKDRPEKAIKPFDKIKEGHRDWWLLDGNWERIREGTEYIRGITDTCNNSIEKAAILAFGDDFWTGYTFNVTVKAKDASGFGICTYFQDSLNYYLFRWIRDKDGYKRQLIKIEDGSEKVLVSDNEVFVIDTWYDIGMKIYKDKLVGIVNNKPVLMATDHTFKEGRLGFWTNSSQGAYFDDIKLSVSDSILEINNNRNYVFYSGNGGPFARSLSAWEPNSQKNIYLLRSDRQTTHGYLSKEIFTNVMLNHINPLHENFKFEIITTPIPQDVDVVFEFTSQGKEAIVYKFVISHDEISLLKNGEVLTSNIMKYNREQIEIYRRNNEWTVEIATEKAFEYKDKIETDAWNMAIGYSGIGNGQIFFDRIFIEEQP